MGIVDLLTKKIVTRTIKSIENNIEKMKILLEINLLTEIEAKI